MKITQSTTLKVCLLCWAGFALLELWLYSSALQNPLAPPAYLVWEAPFSLILLLAVYVAALRFLWAERKARVLSAFAILAGLFVALAPVLSLTPPEVTPWQLVVRKSLSRLDLFRDGELEKSYKIALGGNPLGHKQAVGDGKTPIGRYLVKAPASFTSG